MKYEKYLPLGTIAMLKGGSKRVMITGFCCLNDNKMYDYTGCLYPEGYISADKILLFNHDQIERLYAIGFSDDEEKNFKQTLKQLVEQYGMDNKENTVEQNNESSNAQLEEQAPTQPTSSQQEINQSNINSTINPNAINQNVTTEQVNMSNVVNPINESQD